MITAPLTPSNPSLRMKAMNHLIILLIAGLLMGKSPHCLAKGTHEIAPLKGKFEAKHKSTGNDQQIHNCSEDKDCEIALLRCSCMYCARPGDKENHLVDAVNRKFSAQFENMSKCLAEETRRCATAGACAMMGKSVAVCKSGKCTVEFRAVVR